MKRGKGKPGRLPAEEAAKVQDRLLDAALALFNEKGYAKTSMEEIARRAGASTKTLYARFEGKPDLLQALVMRLVETTLATVGHATPEREPRAFLIALGTEIVTNMNKAGHGLLHIALSEARHNQAICKHYNQNLAYGRGLFRQALEGWQAKGLLPELKDAELGATLLMSMLTDMARIRAAMGDPMSKSEIAQYMPYATDVFLRGCGYRPQ